MKIYMIGNYSISLKVKAAMNFITVVVPPYHKIIPY